MEIPKVWIDRNPRNRQHVRAALTLIAELNGFAVTERTVDSLAKLGLRPNRKTTIWKRVRKDAVVIGAFYFLDQPLQLRDNIIVVCQTCKSALQLRPESNTAAVKLCCFCAVDQLLSTYWSRSGPDRAKMIASSKRRATRR